MAVVLLDVCDVTTRSQPSFTVRVLSPCR